MSDRAKHIASAVRDHPDCSTLLRDDVPYLIRTLNAAELEHDAARAEARAAQLGAQLLLHVQASVADLAEMVRRGPDETVVALDVAERDLDEARAEVERLRRLLVAIEDDAEGFADVAWDAVRATSEVRERDDVRAEEAAATARNLAARIIGLIHAAGERAKDGG